MMGVLVVAVIVGGCSDPGVAAAPRAEAHPALQTVIHEQSVLRAGYDQAVATCMSALGHQTFPRDRASHERGLIDTLTIRLPAITIEQARERGYSGDAARATADDGVERAEAAYLDALSADQYDEHFLAYIGDEDQYLRIESPAGVVAEQPGGGCARQAIEQVYGDTETFVALEALFLDIELVPFLVLDTVEQTPASQQKLDEWTECMHGAGLVVATPWEARRAAELQRGDDEQDGPLDTSVAEADAECQATTGLNEHFVREMRDEQNQVIRDHPELFARWSRLAGSLV